MKRLILSAVIIITLVTIIVPQHESFAITIQEIDKQLVEIEKKAKQAAADKIKADNNRRFVTAEIKKEEKSIKELLLQIEEQTERLNKLSSQIDDTKHHLGQTVEELDQAMERVVARDALLRARIRLMYTNGIVSYMDVLFNATSFSDFLDRYNMLKSVVGQDHEILDANKVDRDLVAQKKIEVEEQLLAVEHLYVEAEELKEDLIVQEKKKELQVQILSVQKEEFEGISEEQKKLANELVKKKTELLKKKQEISVYKGGLLLWPLPSRNLSHITSQFGLRRDPFTKKQAGHTGLDVGAPQGTAIVAAEGGVVVIARAMSGYGNTVVIEHGSGLQTWYAHIRAGGIVVKENATVKRGDKIAEVGSTGRSTGPHLHFETRKNGTPVNPMSYLK